MRPLVEQGYVYSAVPPLQTHPGQAAAGGLHPTRSGTRSPPRCGGDNPNAKVEISRFKGLGEMDPHELWETTMNPETRTLRRITLEDAVKADEIFTILMGKRWSPGRSSSSKTPNTW